VGGAVAGLAAASVLTLALSDGPFALWPTLMPTPTEPPWLSFLPSRRCPAQKMRGQHQTILFNETLNN